jgi:hypothetical protein
MGGSHFFQGAAYTIWHDDKTDIESKMVKRELKRSTMRLMCQTAIEEQYVDNLDRGDAVNFINNLCDDLIELLRSGPRLTDKTLGRVELEVLLGSFLAEQKRQLSELIDGLAMPTSTRLSLAGLRHRRHLGR